MYPLASLLFFANTGFTAPCGEITIEEIVAAPQPNVVVVATSPGMAPDVPKAAKIARALSKKGPLTIALQAVGQEQQDSLVKFDSGGTDPTQLESSLPWKSPFPFAPYKGLLNVDSKHVALDVPWQTKPSATTILIPPGYAAILQDGMSGHPVPGPLQTDTATFVAYKDHRMASIALNEWDGAGTLLVVVDTLHVVGGKGIAWQLARQQTRPVTSVLLADRPSCYAGDQVLSR